jgi:DNA mismatch repair ATPase MutL
MAILHESARESAEWRKENERQMAKIRDQLEEALKQREEERTRREEEDRKREEEERKRREEERKREEEERKRREEERKREEEERKRREEERRQREEERRQKEEERRQKEEERRQKEEERRQKEEERRQKEEEKVKEQMEAFRRQSEETDRKIGRLGNRIGEIIEEMVAPALPEQMNVFGYSFGKSSQRTKIKDEKNGILMEIDFLLENGDTAMLVEVKTNLEQRNIDEHIEHMQKMRCYAELHNDRRRFLGAVAGAVISENVKNYALKQGFFVIEPSGDSVRVVKPRIVRDSWG